MRMIVVEDLKKGLRISKEGFKKRPSIPSSIPPFPMWSNLLTTSSQKEEIDLALILRWLDQAKSPVWGWWDLSKRGGRCSLCIPFKNGYNNY